MVGSLPDFCASAASGHANAAPPSVAMNLRLAMSIAISPLPQKSHADWNVGNNTTA